MKSNLKKHILMTALNIVVVVVYFAISFLPYLIFQASENLSVQI